jgi:hypothetical protein
VAWILVGAIVVAVFVYEGAQVWWRTSRIHRQRDARDRHESSRPVQQPRE